MCKFLFPIILIIPKHNLPFSQVSSYCHILLYKLEEINSFGEIRFDPMFYCRMLADNVLQAVPFSVMQVAWDLLNYFPIHSSKSTRRAKFFSWKYRSLLLLNVRGHRPLNYLFLAHRAGISSLSPYSPFYFRPLDNVLMHRCSTNRILSHYFPQLMTSFFRTDINWFLLSQSHSLTNQVLATLLLITPQL